jgi:membrane associated rhomboid family serine protease
MFRVSVVQEWLQLETSKVIPGGQVWRLVTCAFCHHRLSIWHLVFNMLFLYWFGKTLETMYGSREFLLFYLTAAVVASLCFIGLDLVTRESIPAIGASGAVMAVVMLYAIWYPRQRIFIWFFFPIEIRWLVAFYVIFDLHPVLLALAGTPLPTGIAHAAHLGGLAFGYIYWRQGLRLEKYWERLPRIRWDRLVGPRRKIRLFVPPKEPVSSEDEEKLDAVLQKILKQGEASLSDEDREVLRSASERYRKRNTR